MRRILMSLTAIAFLVILDVKADSKEEFERLTLISRLFSAKYLTFYKEGHNLYIPNSKKVRSCLQKRINF